MKTTFTLLFILCLFQLRSQTVTTVAGNGLSGSNNGPLSSATFNGPNGVVTDLKGYIYVADANNNLVRKIDLTAGTVSSLNSSGLSTPLNLATDSARSVYVANFSGFIRKIDTLGVSTLLPGSFVNPDAVAYMNKTVYVTEWNGHKIRTINSGTVGTLSGSSSGYLNGNVSVALYSGPYGITIDNFNNIIVVDRNNAKIRKIDPAGNVTTIAGTTQGFLDGPGNVAQFNNPTGATVDAANNIYVADFNNHKIRKIDPSGNVTTLAGSIGGFADGVGSAAQFNWPASVAYCKVNKCLYVADYSNNRIRKIDLYCNAASDPTLTASSVSLCIGNTTTLNISGSLNGATNWKVYSTGCGSNSVASTPGNSIVLSPTTTTTYYVRGEGGCASTSTICGMVTVTVSPFSTPTLAISGTNSLCAGSTITQTVSGANTYTWSTGANTSVIFLTPTITTTYNVMGTDGNGCSNSTSKTISVNPVPNVNISGNSSICSGSSIILSASGASTYSWNTGATSSSISITPTITLTYSVIGTSVNGCSNTAVKTVSVNPIPTITITGNNITCAGVTLVQTASGANVYNWNTGANTATVSVSPTVTTSYTVFGTDANGCSNAAVKTVSVNPLPTLSVAGNKTLCLGSTVTQTVSGANSYTWSSGANTGIVFLSPTVTTTYSVSGTDGNGCINTAFTTISVTPLPNINIMTSTSVICPGETTTLTANGALSYSWNTGSNSTNIVVTLTTNTTFTVIGTSASGCTNTSTFTQSVSTCSGINNNALSSVNVLVFPNPNNGTFNIELPGFIGNCEITLINSLGQTVYYESNLNEKNQIKTSLASGLYYYVLKEKGSQINKGKIIIK